MFIKELALKEQIIMKKNLILVLITYLNQGQLRMDLSERILLTIFGNTGEKIQNQSK